ncbi:flagellar biosynthesis protein FlhB [Marinomonas algicola]|uniref:flagellar biosynthesis protein FlhB n=1 Tax=Marinomonas algicola TaxID=2773454 RepID=UPI00174C047C|nr:flagellar biosynthesis protein FlhB [Marinomonas algicola]
MAENEDGSEKTESATSKKLSDAKKKGNLARSKDLSSATLLIVAAVSIYGTGSLLVDDLMRVFSFNFVIDRKDVFEISRMIFHLYESLLGVGNSTVFLMGVLAVAGIIGSVAMGGLNFSWEPMMPKLSKMNPIAGIKRMFSTQSLVELFKSIAKVVLVMGVAYIVLNLYLVEVLGLTFQSIDLALAHGVDILIWAFIFVSLTLIFIAAIDVPYQIWSHAEKLKMTKQEVKDEYKQQEGDPEVKGKIRQAQRQAAMRRMMSDVPKADVIITNPTHFSVALQYDASGGQAAPILLAKGHDVIALKIREVGNFYEIPVIQSPVLARAIYHHTEIGDEIPEGLFKTVAQLLAYVYQLKQAKNFAASDPGPLPPLDVPEDLKWGG